MKISVILPTNKKNNQSDLSLLSEIHSRVKSCRPDYVFSEEFSRLCEEYLKDSHHILMPTLLSLSNQTFKDFEVLLCHKYPEDVEEIAKELSKSINIHVIKEKPSIWHEIGNYPTVNNIRNTSILEVKGEILLFIDDCMVFNQNLLQEMWDAYQEGFYGTAKAIRRIRYEPEAVQKQINAREIIVDKDIRGSNNFFGLDIGKEISIAASWTYCTSVSRRETLKIGGFDECWDGSFGGTDMDFGRRLSLASRYRRKIIGYIYEFALSKSNPNRKIRNDEVLRRICGQSPIPRNIVANSWKPTKEEMDKYEIWHKKNVGELDANWNKLLDIPLFNMREERRKLNE